MGADKVVGVEMGAANVVVVAVGTAAMGAKGGDPVLGAFVNDDAGPPTGHCGMTDAIEGCGHTGRKQNLDLQ